MAAAGLALDIERWGQADGDAVFIGHRAALAHVSGVALLALAWPEVGIEDLIERPGTRQREGLQRQSRLVPGPAPGARVFVRQHGRELRREGGHACGYRSGRCDPA